MANGIRKAAMLLMDLPPATAAELLRCLAPDTITRVVAELAYLQSAPPSDDLTGAVREFSGLVTKKNARAMGGLAKQILETTLGAAQAQETMHKVQELLHQRDPFGPIRAASPQVLATAMKGEAPQVTAMVLVELPPAKSAQLMALLPEELGTQAVQCMAAGLQTAPEVRRRVADMIASRLVRKDGQIEVIVDGREGQLRKVAVLVRGLEKPLRDALLAALTAQDTESAGMIRRLMVSWEDLVLVGDRALQEVLRTVDARKLAMALVKADPVVVQKIRSNISERAGAMVDEEASLLSSPKAQDTKACREAILEALRALNDRGELPLSTEEAA